MLKREHLFWYPLLGTLLLLVLAACAGGATNASRDGQTPSSGQSVYVVLTEFRIASSVTSFTPEVPYHFVVTNNGKMAHEFMITPTDMTPGMSMERMDKMALAMIATLAPGETKTVDVTFPLSDAGKEIEFACHFPGHYEAGMKLESAVTK